MWIQLGSSHPYSSWWKLFIYLHREYQLNRNSWVHFFYMTNCIFPIYWNAQILNKRFSLVLVLSVQSSYFTNISTNSVESILKNYISYPIIWFLPPANKPVIFGKIPNNYVILEFVEVTRVQNLIKIVKACWEKT